MTDLTEAQIDRMTQEISRQSQEITRYRTHLKAIADHHEDERDRAQSGHCDAAARYHEERRNVAMFPLTCPQARGERPLLEDLP